MNLILINNSAYWTIRAESQVLFCADLVPVCTDSCGKRYPHRNFGYVESVYVQSPEQ